MLPLGFFILLFMHKYDVPYKKYHKIRRKVTFTLKFASYFNYLWRKLHEIELKRFELQNRL